MANNRPDNVEGQDEGEYHFSDDQMNYEMDEVPAPEEPKRATTLKDSLPLMMAKYRRPMIGTVVFLIILFIIYRMLAPATTVPNTEFTQAQPEKIVSPKVVHKAVPTSMTVAEPVATKAPPPPVSVVVQSPTAMPNAVLQPPSASDQLASLAQQNAKLVYFMETEVPQRLALAEQQNASVQTKMQDLTARVANIEESLNQLTQLLQGGAGMKPAGPPPDVSSNAPPSPASFLVKPATEPKILYTVQAIIPGRAWLKADSGETVTVAVDDVIKDLGKVTKIDPYDGVVDIDTGTKVITLTYGGGSS